MLAPYPELLVTYLIRYPFIHGVTFFFLTITQYYIGLAYMQAILTSPTPFQSKQAPPSPNNKTRLRLRIKPQAFIQAFTWGIILTLVGYALNILLANTENSIFPNIKPVLHSILYGAIWGVTIPNIAISWVNLSIIHYVTKHPSEIDGQVQYSEIATLHSYKSHLISMLLILSPLFIFTLNTFVIGTTIGIAIYILDLTLTIKQKETHTKQQSKSP